MNRRNLESGENTGTFRQKLNDNFIELYSNSGIDTGLRSLSGNWQSTFTTVRTNSATTWNYRGTDIKALSGNWQSTFTTVRTNSATTWNYQGTDIKALTGDFDSTFTTVQSNSATWNYQGTDIKALTGDFSVKSELVNYFPLSGGTITGNTRITSNVTIYGDVSATGNSYFANTIYSTTSALSVVNLGNTGPAFYVGNNGTGDIASFYDLDQNVEVLHVGGHNGSFPNVGVKTSTPNKDFTVNGEISASNTIWTPNGNSNNWNSVYTNVQSNSANWDAAFTSAGSDLSMRSLSSNWQSTFLTTSALSANYILDGGNTKGSNLLIGTNDNFNLALETNGSPRVTILNSGNVGIGTSAPNEILTIVGNISSSGNIHVQTATEASIVSTIVSSAVSLNLNSASMFLIPLNSNVEVSFTNPPPSSRVCSFTVALSADGTTRSVTWPTTVRWTAGTAPTITSASGKVDILSFLTNNGGISYYGFTSDQNL